ncbi:EAL domain-containing protein [Hyphomonas adhaerens MHS-3]|uniref:EAL domain-containing protein n=3 Tax=Hyphomonas adhaerens TaxID=81029 RepID=A0A069E6I3_9PROT|nr:MULTISPECIES: EAL domain-containing protein [Hyphomonas]KCZ83203.1 EAL domain-containing protein [Hyphomonas adhaerens MHS-3]MBB40619.1 diguanylate phosphodiesterase [Hyphomonas sp.]|tara:strand:- start:1163 stop:2392 length:1230 start_codon:yes stop_codon:yes gene_type:complete
MTFLLFLLYMAAGGAAGYASATMLQLGLPLSVGAGVLTTAVLSQIHVLVSNGSSKREIDARMQAIEKENRDAERRMDVVEARTDVVEETVKHELTERRDALVSEMKQLEGLIDRLSHSFETRLAETSSAKIVAPQEDAILRDVRDALKDGRVDLHLQPIVSLPQRRVSFYEGFTRLRRPDGSLILPAEFLDAGRRANLMGQIDNFTLFRCVQIVRRLAERDRRVGVFCNIAASSLEDSTFFPFFLEFMTENRDLSGAVIFEIRADRFETRSRTMRDNMDKLTELGFRFSIDHAPDLGLDLPRLQSAGVRFVKMNGAALIDQLRDPAGPRPVSSINRRVDGEEVSAVFSRYGITMVAEKMEDEASVVEILEYEIPYGQGHVFGAPRPIKASLMQETAPPREMVQRMTNFG